MLFCWFSLLILICLFNFSMPGITFNICHFKPFNLQSGMDNQIHILVQEIINYAESRFGHILNIISGFDSETQGWMQKLLQKELVHMFELLFSNGTTDKGKAFCVIICRSCKCHQPDRQHPNYHSVASSQHINVEGGVSTPRIRTRFLSSFRHWRPR